MEHDAKTFVVKERCPPNRHPNPMYLFDKLKAMAEDDK